MKLETKSVNLIDVQDWNAFISNEYGKIYNFQQQDNCKSRGIEHIVVPECMKRSYDFVNSEIPLIINGPIMGVSFEAWLKTCPYEDPFFQDEWKNKLFWERNFYPDVSMIIADLYSKEKLSDGHYIINIDW